ncbi:MAG: hypothetical protein HKM89_08345, partial [Gemmatimonadales bacterium]|nr:hypothetical protein [Gemmatimonadales bacterium]
MSESSSDAGRERLPWESSEADSPPSKSDPAAPRPDEAPPPDGQKQSWAGDGKGDALPWESSGAAGSAPPRVPEQPVTEQWGTDMHDIQQVKGRIHRRLLERLNLSNLDKLERDQGVAAIRKVVHELLTQESVPLNYEERELLVGQVLD